MDFIFNINNLTLLTGGGFFTSVVLNGLLSYRLRLKQKDLSPDKKEYLQQLVTSLSNKLNVTKKLDIVLTSSEFGGEAQAMGNTLLPGRAGIAITPSFLQLTKYQQEFILAHEISHIKHQDLLTLGLVPGLATIITRIALPRLFPKATAVSSNIHEICFLMGCIAYVIFSQWREKCADQAGFAVCSNQAKMAAIKLFKDAQEHHQKLREDTSCSLIKRMFFKMTISAKGNNRLDVLHPSFTSRITNLIECVDKKRSLANY